MGLLDRLSKFFKKKLPEDIKKRLDSLVYNCNLNPSQENIGRLEDEINKLRNEYGIDYYKELVSGYRRRRLTNIS